MAWVEMNSRVLISLLGWIVAIEYQGAVVMYRKAMSICSIEQ